MDLIQLVNESSLDQQQSDYIISQFGEFEKIAAEWKEKAETIEVTDESQTDLMDLAREGRLAMKKVRTSVEKTRKELKQRSLNEGRAIDAIAKHITGLVSPIEDYLDNQENFIEIQNAKREQELLESRLPLINELDLDMSVHNFRTMPDSDFQLLCDGKRKQIADEQERIRKEEEERKAKEAEEAAERERIRQENEKLRAEKEAMRKEQEEKDRILREERAKREAAEREQREAEEKAAKAKREAELAKQREEYAKKTKEEAVQKAESKTEDLVLTVSGKLELARKLLKIIYDITIEADPFDDSCECCSDVHELIEREIEKIGGFLE